MNDFNLKNEMKFIFLRTMAINLIVYGVSVVFIGINFTMITGLLLGSGVLFFNLHHLYRSIVKITSFGGKGKNPMMGGYILRSLIVCIAVAISLKCSFINTVGTVLPLFYPKVIYTLYSIVKGGK
jgi:hypothetical protein